MSIHREFFYAVGAEEACPELVVLEVLDEEREPSEPIELDRS